MPSQAITNETTMYHPVMPMKGVPTRIAFRVKSVIREKDGRRRIFGTASTEAIDRAHEIIRQDGWKVENFLKNAVFLFAHRSWEAPIGLVENLKVQNGEMVFEALETMLNANEEINDPLAKFVFDKYEVGEMKMFSVGFLPLEWIYHSGKDTPEDMKNVLEYVSQELLEISAVSIGCNQEALTNALRKMLTRDHPAPFQAARISTLESSIALFANSQVKSVIEAIAKEGRELSTKNRNMLEQARENINSVLKDLEPKEDDKAIVDELAAMEIDYEKAIRLLCYSQQMAKLLIDMGNENIIR